MPGKVIKVSTIEEYEAAKKSAEGPVVLEFVAKDCGFCEDEIPKVDKLVNECANITVIRADADALTKLADDEFKIDGTPTLLYAKKASDLEPGKAKELPNSDALRRKLKCARPPK